jgi:hypothetical protein
VCVCVCVCGVEGLPPPSRRGELLAQVHVCVLKHLVATRLKSTSNCSLNTRHIIAYGNIWHGMNVTVSRCTDALA